MKSSDKVSLGIEEKKWAEEEKKKNRAMESDSCSNINATTLKAMYSWSHRINQLGTDM